MKTKILFPILFLVALKVGAQTWDLVGMQGFSTPVSQYSLTSLALDNNGIPHIAYSDASFSNKLTVMKYNGSAWEVVGTSGFTADQGYDVSIAFDLYNTPYVAFGDNANSSRASVMKFTGSWVYVGVAGFSDGVVNNCTIKFGSDDVPIVTYVDAYYSGKAVGKKFDGANWANLGTPGFTAGGTGQMTMALNLYNQPYVAYQDQANGFAESVMMHNGTDWVHVGNNTFSNGTVQFSHIAFDNTGLVPYVCYNQGFGTFAPNVQRFNGSSWEYVGSENFNTNMDYQNNIALDGNNVPYVIFPDGAYAGKASVMNYDGSSWVYTGNTGFSSGQIWYPNIVTDQWNNVYVQYYDEADANKISVLKFGTCNSLQTDINVSLCPGDSVFAGGDFQTTPGQYSDTYVSSNGCDSIVNTLVQYTFTFDLGNDASACENENVLFDAGVGGANYLWSTGETTQTIMVSQTDNYSVTVTVNNCSQNDEVNATFHTNPFVNLGNDTTICFETEYVLNAGNGFGNYLWQDGSATQTFTITSTTAVGVYLLNVIVTNDFGCSGMDSATVTVELCSGIDLVAGNNFTISPIPATDEIQIYFDKPEQFQLTIYNILGEEVKTIYSSLAENITIDISDFASGIYQIVISGDKRMMTNKFVRE